jgi:HK97 family phage major capsid protein
MELEAIKTHLDTVKSEIKEAVSKRDAEVKQFGEATEQTRKALTAATERLDTIKSDMDRMDARVIEMEKAAQRQFAGQAESKSIGSQFVESAAFKAASSRGTDAVRVNKSITSLAASAGALVNPMRRADVIINAERRAFIRDLLTTIPTTSNAVEVMRENVFTNNAAPQQPSSASTAIGAGDFEAKPQSNVTYELITVPVRTMAHWVPASRQVLSDAPMLQRLIDAKLMYGLNLLSDTQLLYGAGTNQSLTGLMVDSGVSNIGQIAAGTTAAQLPGAMLDHIRAAITQNQVNEYYNINGVVMNPLDWATLETAKGTDGHYLWVSVPNGGEQRLWRVPVIVSNAMNAGDFLLGDWTMGATIYDREQMDVRVSESHADYFVKNGVAVLAEERYGFGIELPKAYTKGKFTVAPTPPSGD